jgi:murein L,D-transpeptidase YcbB/YkuD
LSEAVASNQRQVVILEDPMPVHLVYLTAWVAANGESHFREDIYGHDQTLFSALSENTPTPLAWGNGMPYPVYWGRL